MSDLVKAIAEKMPKDLCDALVRSEAVRTPSSDAHAFLLGRMP